MFKKTSFGEMVTILFILLGFASVVGVTLYKISRLESEVKNIMLENGQIKQKIIKSNQVTIDFVLKSPIDEKAKNEFKKRFDEINADWFQFIDGLDIKGPSFSGHEDKPSKLNHKEIR